MQRADVERTCTDFSRWWDDALLHQVNAHVAMAVCGDWLPLQLNLCSEMTSIQGVIVS